MLQGTDHLTEINGAEFVLHAETYGISREDNTALAWERLPDLNHTAFPIRPAVTHCLGVNVKSHLRSRLQSLRHSKTHTERKSLPSIDPVQS